jgi:hypothetical protein
MQFGFKTWYFIVTVFTIYKAISRAADDSILLAFLLSSRDVVEGGCELLGWWLVASVGCQCERLSCVRRRTVIGHCLSVRFLGGKRRCAVDTTWIIGYGIGYYRRLIIINNRAPHTASLCNGIIVVTPLLG